MQFDDRLATVLRMQAGNERAAHTQYRQLLDLVGSAPEGADEGLLERAFGRLEALSSQIDAQARGAMIREPGMRLRRLELVFFLSRQEMPVASAAMAAARLTEGQWQTLIPELAIPARSLLRHRKDLPAATMRLLARLGVSDLVLPNPGSEISVDDSPAEAAGPVLDLEPALEAESEGEGIGALVRRIEAFQRARQQAAALSGTDAPRLPLGELEDAEPSLVETFDFTTTADGRIDWASNDVAPMVFGLTLVSEHPDAPARLERSGLDAMRHRQPLRGVRTVLEGAPAIEGDWRIDAAPQFTVPGGSFTGYRGRMLRDAGDEQAADPAEGRDSPAERMRQILHELRTPVNAIQGFAELIQQQLFGPTPNEYRALAASIAGDAAHILAGFDELDRLVRLESGALELDDGSCDFAAIAESTVRQLDSVLRRRTAGFEFTAPGTVCQVALTRRDAEMLAWRLLATLAGATTASEALEIVLRCEGTSLALTAELPAALASRSDIFASSAPTPSQSITAGMFGAGFALRLARAEARAADGDLIQIEDMLTLKLPLFSGNGAGIAIDDNDPGARLAGSR